MNQPKDLWEDVDRYVSDLLIAPDAALDQVLRSSAEAGLPAINVSPAQGKLLHLLARIHGAKKILEIGTLAGYSTIWLARALLADGKIITLESEPKHAAIARRNFANAGLEGVVELIEANALDTLPRLANRGPFDLTFIDADKQSNAEYFAWAVRLSRPGSLIIVDNVVRGGAVIDADSKDESVQGVRRFMTALASETRVSATAIQTVGAKGHDGLAVAVVTAAL
ncbi:MAG: O-methyltransferase [Tepidisphaeraceae bacterium]